MGGMEAIRAGLQIFYSLPCAGCDGKGFIIAKPSIDESTGPPVKVPGGKRDCPKCKGAGRIAVPSIKR